jgi:GNAT superfamily N-acetyltransferase
VIIAPAKVIGQVDEPILRDFSPKTLAKAIEANQIGFYADVGRSSQIQLNDDPEILWFLTGVPFASFNRVLRARFEGDDVDAKVDKALAPFKDRRVPMMWHTGPSTRPTDLGQRLVARGLVLAESEPGMAADLLALRDDPLVPTGLKIERVDDARKLEMWVTAFARAFALPDALREPTFEVELELGLEQDQPRRLYLGLMAGQPVASSIVFLGAGVAGVYGVGTVPEARRRGIGTAMARVPLLQARALGYRIATLHASPMGLESYRRLGFEEYCVLDRYVLAGDSW